MRVLVADPIASEGIDLLLRAGAQVDIDAGLTPSELCARVPEYDALVVRSETKVTADILAAGKRLLVVGRAGVGVDNIDVDAATQKGVLVANAPTANSIAAAEHTLALMLSLARHIPMANASLKSGRWNRSEFIGTEIRNKVLGVIGLGKVGSEVARRAGGFDMQVLAHDPFISVEHAERLGVEMVDLDLLLQQSDFVTLHVPMTAAGGLPLGSEQLSKMKQGAMLINASRGGVIEEQALYEAVDSGHISGAAVDVFAEEPARDSVLFKSDRIIVTPHLGASTREAQSNVAVEIAEQVLEVLNGRPASHAVNAPMVVPEALGMLIPFLEVGRTVGNLATQLSEGQFSQARLALSGEIAEHDPLFLKAAVVGGLLAPVIEERVNVVNVDMIVSQRGMDIGIRKEEPSETYRNLLTVELTTSAGTTIVSGTNIMGRSHIVRINEFWLDITPGDGYMLLIENQDRPGVIGAVGTVAGKNDVNISFMEVGRLGKRGNAIMALGIDEPLPLKALDVIAKLDGVLRVRMVRP